MSTRTRSIPHAAVRATDHPTPAQLKDLFAQIEARSPHVTKDRMQSFLRGRLVDPASLEDWALRAPAMPPPNPLLDSLSEAFREAIPEFADEAIGLVRPFCDPNLDMELKPYVDHERALIGRPEVTGTMRLCQDMVDAIPHFRSFKAKLVIVGQRTDRFPYLETGLVTAENTDLAVSAASRSGLRPDMVNNRIFGETMCAIQMSNPRLVNSVFAPMPCYADDGLVHSLKERIYDTGAVKYRLINPERFDIVADHIVDLLRTAIVFMVIGHAQHVAGIKAMLAAQVSGHPFFCVNMDDRVVYFLARPR